MIDVAARATNGVKLPSRSKTRRAIIDLFKRNLTNLRRRLLVSHLLIFFVVISNTNHNKSDAVKGRINLTCDAWQASNVDGYFALTGHWIEERTVGVWSVQSALLGFTRLNNAHNGVRLGQALFKLVKRVGIAHKVSKILAS